MGVLRLRTGGLADDRRRSVLFDEHLAERLKLRAVHRVGKGQMALFAAGGVLDLGKVGVKMRSPLILQNLRLPVENGGVFFIGMYLGSLFLMATVLIIYYKQISEGFDDRERYQIMQKVGMSKREVKSSIRSQILMVFFLPLAMAIIHIAVAFPVITKLLAIFYLKNTKLFFGCTAGTVGIFAVFYVIIFVITAKEYYKIVE